MAEKSTSLKTVPASKAALSRVELRSAGRALRDKVSRRSHADWPVSSDRQDPIELLIESNKGRIPQLIPIRYGRMKQSPFAFFRGAACNHGGRSGQHANFRHLRASLWRLSSLEFRRICYPGAPHRI